MPFEARKTKFTVFSLNQELFNLINPLKNMSGFMETVLMTSSGFIDFSLLSIYLFNLLLSLWQQPVNLT